MKRSLNQTISHHEGSFGVYMANKIAKLENFNNNIDKNDVNSNIFQNCRIFVNGHVEPSIDQLKLLILSNGGQYYGYQLSDTTHFVCNTFTEAQLRQIKGKRFTKPYDLKYVTVSWILDSIKQSKKLIETDYLPMQLLDNSQNKIIQFFEKSNTNFSKDVNEKEVRTFDAVYSPSKHIINNSETNPDFLNQYFSRSRLHFIGVWRNRLANLVDKLNKSNNKTTSKPVNRSNLCHENRLVVHIDMDCFFVSALIRNDPALRETNIPIGVAHSSTGGTSEISSCNYAARAKGVKNGMFMSQAKKLCPEIKILSYDFNLYEKLSIEIYKYLYSHDLLATVEPVSVDEAYVEYNHINDDDIASKVTHIRDNILQLTGCVASAGIGKNMLIARLATKKAKPNGQLMVNRSDDDILKFMRTIKLSDLPGIGYANIQKLSEKQLVNCEDIWPHSLITLKNWFGEALGNHLYKTSRGIDESDLKPVQPRQSIGAEVNWGLRFTHLDNANKFIYQLSKELSNRLIEANRKGYRLTIKVKSRSENAPKEPKKFLGHGICDNISESMTLHQSIYLHNTIFKNALHLFHNILKNRKIDVIDLRGLGIQMSRLVDMIENENLCRLNNQLNNNNDLKQSIEESIPFENYDSDDDNNDYNYENSRNDNTKVDELTFTKKSNVINEETLPTVNQEIIDIPVTPISKYIDVDLSNDSIQSNANQMELSSNELSMTQQEFLRNIPNDIFNEILLDINNQLKPYKSKSNQEIISLLDDDSGDERENDNEGNHDDIVFENNNEFSNGTTIKEYNNIINYLKSLWDNESNIISQKSILLYIQLLGKAINPCYYSKENNYQADSPLQQPNKEIFDDIMKYTSNHLTFARFDLIIRFYDNLYVVITTLNDCRIEWLRLYNELKTKINKNCTKLYSAKLFK